MVRVRLPPAPFLVVIAVPAVASAGTICYRPAAFPRYDDLQPWDCTPGSAPKEVVGGKMQGLQFNVTCDDPSRCEEVQAALMQVRTAVESAIKFEQPVLVDLQYRSFCALSQQAEGCAAELAIARPANWIPMLDDDGDQRLYPQALVKQLGHPAEAIPAYTSTDIVAAVSTDVKWALPQASNVTSDQEDIVYVITHEMIHGLGFYSSWRPQQELNGLITPFVEQTDGLHVVTGWKEFAFDRYIIEADTRTRLSSYAARYRNEQVLQLVVGRTLADAASRLSNSPYANETSGLVRRAATTPGALALAPYPVKDETQPVMMLESGLGSFVFGKSVVHASVKDHGSGADALMIYTTRPGLIANGTALTTSIPPPGENSTNANSSTSAIPLPNNSSSPSPPLDSRNPPQTSGPGRVELPHDRLVGPSLVRAMSLLGYKTSANPKGGYVPNLAPSKSPMRPRLGSSAGGRRSVAFRGAWAAAAVASGLFLIR